VVLIHSFVGPFFVNNQSLEMKIIDLFFKNRILLDRY
jgi:hypothetical protein